LNKPTYEAMIVPATIPTRLKAKAVNDSPRVLTNLCFDSEPMAFDSPLKSWRGIVNKVAVKDFWFVGSSCFLS